MEGGTNQQQQHRIQSNQPGSIISGQFILPNQQQAVDLIPVSERGRVEHTEDEIKLYGHIINLDLEGEDQELWWLAKQGLEAPIPKDWRAYQSSSSNAAGSSSMGGASSGNAQIVYVNHSQNKLTLQHPLDPYFKALAKREQCLRRQNIASGMSGYMGMSLEEFKNDSSLLNNQATLLDDKCIEKANEVLTDLQKFREQIQNDKYSQINEGKREQLQEKEERLQLLKKQTSSKAHDKELQLLERNLTNKLKQLNDQLQKKQDTHAIQLRAQNDARLLQQQESMKNQIQSQKSKNKEKFESQLKEFKAQEQDKYNQRVSKLKQEFNELKQLNELKVDFENHKKKHIERIANENSKKLELMLSQLEQGNDRKISQIYQGKMQADGLLRQRISQEKSNEQTLHLLRMDNLKQDHERKMEQLKEKVAARLKLKFTDAQNEITQSQSGVFKKEIEIYKRLKEQELRKGKVEIDEHYEQMIEEQKRESEVKSQQNSQDGVRKFINSFKSSNEELKQKIVNKIEEIQQINPEYNENSVRPTKLQKQFETIGDIEETQYNQPFRTARVDHEQYRYSKSPITQKNIDMMSMGFVSKNLSDPSRSSSTPKQMTPHVSSSVSHQLLYFNTPSNQSNEVVDKYKMREIRSYVANELYKQEKKTQALYDEFSRLKALRDDMTALNQQTKVAVGDNEKPLKRMKQIDQNIDTQYNIVRRQMKDVNARRDVLKRMRDAIKKLGDNMVAKQRIDIETELLNDYNYLLSKMRHESEQSRSSIKSHWSPFSKRVSSEATGETDYERFVGKWEKILQSGTGQNQYEWHYFNEFAPFLVPRQEDIRLNTVRRFEKAVFELKQTDKKSLLLGLRSDIGDKFSFRQRIFARQQEQTNSNQRQIQGLIEGQYQWIKAMKMQLAVPSATDLRQII